MPTDNDIQDANRVVDAISAVEKATIELLEKHGVRVLALVGYHAPSGRFVNLAGNGMGEVSDKNPANWREECLNAVSALLRIKPDGTLAP
jgi:tRNA U34 5-methylaminomethyl-2-thiouridine-forming methyltransferase MnmC